MNQNHEPATPASLTAVDNWFFTMLQRELELKGQGQATGALRKNLKLSVVDPGIPDGNQHLKMKLCQRLTKCSIRLNARSGETVSWYVDFIAKNGDRSMSRDDALDLATQVADPPDDAQLVHADYEDSGTGAIFRARWAHVQDTLPVEGDYIEVLINGRNRHPFAFRRVWRTPHLAAAAVER
jgi:hypothetical protein